MTTLSLQIEGMMCDGCVRRVEKLLSRAGVRNVSGVTIGSAQVEIEESETEPASIVKVLESAGYAVRVRS
ncbi:MAG: heavy-metal-associated domain-containing protein [Bryobacterales bacterium]|nr:heavy-metal-associated domain-containing protein [Bryobacterales bacterium]